MPFEAVLSRGADRAQTQRFKQTLLLAFVAHAMLFCGVALRGGWHVEELTAPVRPLMLMQPPRIQSAPPAAAPPGPSEARPAQRRKQDTPHVPVVSDPPRQQESLPSSASSSPAPSASVVDLGSNSTDDGSDGASGAARNGSGHEGTGSGAAVAVVPPKVGAQRCLDCPLPQLPPAFLHVVSKATLVCKICVNKAGHVSSVDVRQGLSTALDAQVVNAVSAWRFAPITINDNPVPFCYPAVFVWQSVP
ncbi:MAG: energy transducer TonB [Deltaproteobacteria bacterium]|nr:energy transducer TonB [Deltaproteobacteria bacterium]